MQSSHTYSLPSWERCPKGREGVKGREGILSISGSDSTGESGIQADIKTIAALGAYAVTTVTCVSIHDAAHTMYDLPSNIVVGQTASIVSDVHPRAIKIGLVRDAETIRLLRNEIIGCPRLVVAPGIYASDGSLMVDDDAIAALVRYLVPEAMLLMLRCRDAEKMLNIRIATDDDMLLAAKRFHQMGAQWVMLRGGHHSEGRLTALLYGADPTNDDTTPPPSHRFFTSYNTEGWQRHGVGGALSAAIATRLAMGDDVPEAVSNAHNYMHSQVVYVRETKDNSQQRPNDIYNQFVSLLTEHYATSHSVAFYADKLCITTRYLNQVTAKVVGSTPKQIISNHLVFEAKKYLLNTRLNIQEIALKLGFTSEMSFCTFFRRETGKSPIMLRKS